MSKKQEIYVELMRHGMPYTRNILSHGLIYGRKRKETFEIAQLIHSLYVSILEEEFTDHDFWFLNVQARAYCEDNKNSFLYPVIKELLMELFNSVPEEQKGKLEWQGPEA